MTLDELKASAFVVGLKETERAIDRGEAGHVFIASDCDDRISLPLRNVCAKAGISVTDDFTKKEIDKLNLSKTAKITVVGNAENLKWIMKEGKTVVQIPEKLAKKIPHSYAYVLKITK